MTKSILVIGELNVDLIVTGLEALPQLGQEIVCRGLDRALGSSSAIFARGLAGLGAQVDYMGKVGDDENGRFMLAQLREVDIGTDGVVVDPDVQTGVTISLTYPHEKAQITYPGSIAAYSLADVHLDRLPAHAHLHMATMYLQTALRPGFPALLRHAQAQGLTTSLDPGWDPTGDWGDDLYEALAATDILFVNEHEARAIPQASSAEEGARRLAERVPVVIAKLGAEGALLVTRETVLHVGAHRVPVIDTTGAGDSFDAGFIFRHVVQGRSLNEALAFASGCGAIAVTRIGGASSLPSAVEVEAFLEQSSSADRR